MSIQISTFLTTKLLLLLKKGRYKGHSISNLTQNWLAPLQYFHFSQSINRPSGLIAHCFDFPGTRARIYVSTWHGVYCRIYLENFFIVFGLNNNDWICYWISGGHIKSSRQFEMDISSRVIENCGSSTRGGPFSPRAKAILRGT